MTALNFVLSEEAIYVVADTLATNLEFKPAFFTSKVFTFPHWNGVICGRGSHRLILDWVMQMYGGTLAIDLVRADEFTPQALRELFASHPEEEKSGCTTSIYHLGFDALEDRFVGYAYKSVNNFESERLKYGFHQKPGVEIDISISQFPNDFVTHMRQQRLEQDALPPHERAFIGGQIVSWLLERVDSDDQPTFVQTTTRSAFEWDDFWDQYCQCLIALPDR